MKALLLWGRGEGILLGKVEVGDNWCNVEVASMSALPIGAPRESADAQDPKISLYRQYAGPLAPELPDDDGVAIG